MNHPVHKSSSDVDTSVDLAYGAAVKALSTATTALEVPTRSAYCYFL